MNIKKSCQIFLLIIHVIMIVLVSSKAGLASLLFISIVAVFSATSIKRKLTGVSVAFLIIIGSLTIPSTQLRIKKAYESILADKTELPQNSTTNRITLVKTLKYFSPKELILGQGINTSQHKIQNLAGINKNLHNQFLQTLISSGFMGLCLLIVFLISPLYQTRSIFVKVLVGIVFLNLFFENMLDRVWGIIFISFFYGLFLFGDLQYLNKKSEEINI